MKFKKTGVSLIVLVITILVMVILTTVIVLNVVENNPIESSKEVAFKNDLAGMKEELHNYILRKLSQSPGNYDETTLYASNNTLEENGSKIEEGNIKTVLPNIEEKYIGKVEVVKGELKYINTENMKEYIWALNVLENKEGNYEAAQIKDSSTLELEKAKEETVENMKICGNSEQRSLPDEYQQVEYIESTGTQYIDTNVVSAQVNGIECSFSLNSIGSENQGILGGGYTADKNSFQIVYNGKTEMLSAIWKSQKYNFLADKNKHTIFLSKQKITVDAETFETYEENLCDSDRRNVIVFARNKDNLNIGESDYGSMKLYSLKIWGEFNTLVRDFIPCYRKSDNVIGMYDMISQKFYTNNGTGTFTKGKNVTSTINTVIKSVGDYDVTSKKYKIPVTVSGKNLFDISNVTKLIGTDYKQNRNGYGSISDGIVTSKIGVYGNSAVLYDSKISLSAGTYTVSADFMVDKDSGNKGTTIGICFPNLYKTNVSYLSASKYRVWERKSHTFTLDEETEIAILVQGTGEKGDYLDLNTKIKNIQIESGKKSTDYEIYYNETYSIYLNEPLRKFEDAVDYIDFKRSKVIRNVKEENGELRKLETPEIEIINLPDILTKSGMNVIKIQTNITPSKIDAIYSKEK